MPEILSFLILVEDGSSSQNFFNYTLLPDGNFYKFYPENVSIQDAFRKCLSENATAAVPYPIRFLPHLLAMTAVNMSWPAGAWRLSSTQVAGAPWVTFLGKLSLLHH